AGTAVGQEGLGVAPGAQWMAVRILDPNGFGTASGIHTAYQWLLAPGGDPDLAPDVINNSWGAAPYSIEYRDDVAALRAAGIVSVFAAGNGGPLSGSINAPASYTDTLAVGASDDLDNVAWFSSRGPSPLTAQVKPTLVAPGTHVYSALPGGLYGYATGTSMAAPHLAGAAALTLAADPQLSEAVLTAILTSTAVPLSTALPNDDTGWGRLDVYAAVAGQVESGAIEGVVRSNGLPLPGVVVTVTTSAGAQLAYQTDGDGRYQATLRPGSYDLTVAPFGYAAESVAAVPVQANQTTIQNVDLTQLPGATLTGFVRDSHSQAPLTATIRVEGTPVEIGAAADGSYTVWLPAGTYPILALRTGYRLGRATVTITPGQITVQDFLLGAADSILLVDSGQWLYTSYLDYYQAALEDADYGYDVWPVRDPYQDVPAASDLGNYDVVVWSSPYDSPGLLGAGRVISDYLGLGGRFLISGQDVGSTDGVGWLTQDWWYDQLRGSYLGEAVAPFDLGGVSGTHFAELVLTLNGPDSTGNQVAPDAAEPQADSLTESIFLYADGRPGGLQAGLCEPFRIVYLGFGLEGVSGAENRAEVVSRSLVYFDEPPNPVGVSLSPLLVDDFALPGSHLVYTVTVRNLSEQVTDTMALTVNGATWPASVVTPTLTLGPCQSGQSVVTIDVPAGLAAGTVHTLTVTAVSNANNAYTASLTMRHRTPGHVLLVDDDRWYDQETLYQAALDGMGLLYDVWDTGWDQEGRGSPSAEFLSYYDLVIWYTGYDWFAPVTAGEVEAVTSYLGQGGRLFLTSQDFLYYHYQDALTQDYLGIISYVESVTPTLVYGGEDAAFMGNLAGPLALDYGAYQNFSDGLIPAATSQAILWHDQGMAAGVASVGSNWRTIFWGLPFETLPVEAQPVAMNRVVGWLSDLGDSTFTADQRSTPAGVRRTYTITLRNLAGAPTNQVSLTNTLPAGLELDPTTITGGAGYDPIGRQLTWSGSLASGAEWPITYQAEVAAGLAAGTRLDNALTIGYQRHQLHFDRLATVWVAAPDLTTSGLAFSSNTPRPGDTITAYLILRNDGDNHHPVYDTTTLATLSLPDALHPLTATLQASGGAADLDAAGIHWEGEMRPGDVVTVSLVLTADWGAELRWLPFVAVIDDQATDPLVRDAVVILTPHAYYFPLLRRSDS
ncbi:MAG: S8 family serine peptidase, partial [Chloroflexota bacterium]